jgi:predicted transcriptional regulator
MAALKKIVRQSVSLPADTARRVQSLAKGKRLSASRMLVELVEDGLAAQERKEQEFFSLAARFRAATDKKDIKKLGNELGRMVFGG